MVAVSIGFDSGLRMRVVRTFRDREEQTGDVSIPTVVIHG